jgi:lysophospholipase L1-like esterase
MNRIVLALSAALFLNGTSFILGQANPPTHEPEASVGDPSNSTTTPSNFAYTKTPLRMKMLQNVLDEAKGKPVDILFIGDSITARWRTRDIKPLWDKYYAPRHALDFGVAGDKTQNVLWRLDNIDLSAYHPKVAVIMIGTNNGALNTAPEIAAGVKAVVQKTQQLFPGVKIILVTITPSKYMNDKKMAVDAIIRTYADNSSVYYLDLVPLMPPVGDNWKGIGPDHLHPDVTGFQIWHDAMEPLLSRLLTGSK